jgi:hypothetical protein
MGSYFYLFSRQHLFEQHHIAASHISFLRTYFENTNLEVPHQVVFLDETWVNPKYGVMEIASLLRRGDQEQVPGTLSCMLEHKMDLFLVRV